MPFKPDHQNRNHKDYLADPLMVPILELSGCSQAVKIKSQDPELFSVHSKVWENGTLFSQMPLGARLLTSMREALSIRNGVPIQK
jgi:hypothetical protein